MCRKILIIAFFPLLAGICLADKKTDTATKKTTPKTYGSASVNKVAGVDEDFVFRCDIKEWPAIIGEDIAVRIDGIAPPSIVAREGGPGKFFESQTKKFLERTFVRARAIRLENIRRGRTFSIVADVVVDSNSLADLMIEEGLARRYATEEKQRVTAKKPVPVKYRPGTSVAHPAGLAGDEKQAGAQNEVVYIASKNSKIFHRSTCRYSKSISSKNLVKFASKAKVLQTGRRPCKTCSPFIVEGGVMMPPKVRQITNFVTETERALSGFSQDAMAMRGRLPELRNIIRELAQVAPEIQDKELQGCLSTLEVKARNCRDCIERRLLMKN
jgi:endonuclease YncB( thermonuclease family)